MSAQLEPSTPVACNPGAEAWRLARALGGGAGVLHVGAGVGLDLPPYAELGMQQVLLVEADETRHRELARRVSGHAGWRTQQALVAETSGPGVFHRASNASESGLLNPASLRAIWRSLQATEECSLPAHGLTSMFDPTVSAVPDWLVIDCLPALSLIRGLGSAVAGLTVIAARVVQEPAAGVPEDASHGALRPFLVGHGFHLLATIEERHPALAMVVYVRDWRRASGQLDGELAALRQRYGNTVADGQRLALRVSALEAQQAEALATAASQRASADERERRLDTALGEAAQREAALELKLNERQARIDGLLAEHAAAESAQAARLAALQAELAQARDTHDRHLAALQADHEQGRQTLERRLEALQQERAEAQRSQGHQIAALEAALVQTRAEAATAAEQLKAQAQVLTTAVAEREQAHARALQEARQAADKAQQSLRAELEIQARKASELEARAATLKSERDEATQRAQARQAQLDALGRARRLADDALAQGSAQAANLGRELAETRAERANAQERLARSEAALADTQAQLIGLRQAVAELQPALEAARRALEESERGNRELRARAGALKQRGDLLERELAEVRARQQQLQDEITRAEAQLDLIKELALPERQP